MMSLFFYLIFFLTDQIQTSVLQTHTAVTSMPCALTPKDRTVVLAQQVIQGMVGHAFSQVRTQLKLNSEMIKL